MKTIDLSGQTAVITGASRGIGRAIAEEFARAGANLVVNYNRTPCEDLIQFATEQGVEAIAVQADISQSADCERLIDEAVKKFGRVDTLVNNAGITRDALFMRMDDQAWDDVINTNLRSAFSTCKAVSKTMMKQRSGSIVNIASVSGILGLAGQANYAASKGGLISFTKTIARELAGRGVRANIVAPGFIASDMTAVLDDKLKAKVLEEIPLKKYGEGADIANAVLFLSSPMAAYITGNVLVVDGGMTMR